MTASRIEAPLEREPVTPDDRRAMTPARKRRIHEARKGKCWFCGHPVPVDGPDVRYDHKLPLELGGSDGDENLWPLHTEPCDRIKTVADRKRIDKCRRQRAKNDGTFPPPLQRLKGRGFPRRWNP